MISLAFNAPLDINFKTQTVFSVMLLLAVRLQMARHKSCRCIPAVPSSAQPRLSASEMLQSQTTICQTREIVRNVEQRMTYVGPSSPSRG